MPRPEEVEEPPPGGETEEDCGAGGQGYIWWLGKWKSGAKTEKYGNTVTSSTSGVGCGKNEQELGHNQLGSKCNTKTISNQKIETISAVHYRAANTKVTPELVKLHLHPYTIPKFSQSRTQTIPTLTL